MLAVMGPLLALLGVEAQSITANVKRRAIVWGSIGVMGLIFATFVLVSINTSPPDAYRDRRRPSRSTSPANCASPRRRVTR